MESQRLKTVFAVGETIGVEFKRCGNGIESTLNVYGTKNEPLNETLSLDGTRNELLNETLNSFLTSNEVKILRVIRKSGDITQREISRETSLSQSTVKRLMKNLMEKGVLIRSGSKRTGVWRVLSDSLSK